MSSDPMQVITHDEDIHEVIVHLPSGSIHFDAEGRVEDGPAVLVDNHGWIASCEICGWNEGFGGDMVSCVLARYAANNHCCEEIQQALNYLTTIEDKRKEITHGDD